LGKVIHAFLMYYLVGVWFHLFFIIPYRSMGKLTVVGIERYAKALERGRIVIVANHPLVVESYFLSVLLADSFWKRIPERWPYSFPDPNSFLPRWLWWFFPLIRCIQVERDDEYSRQRALRAAITLLREGEAVVIHPEGGRTSKGEFIHCFTNGRRLRVPLTEGVALLAGIKDVLVLPVWVEPHEGTKERTLSYASALRIGVTIAVGDAFSIPKNLTREEVMSLLTHRLVSVPLDA
jgi:1-acyl-sn-glycerol-3-phosphate acyltransferase